MFDLFHRGDSDDSIEGVTPIRRKILGLVLALSIVPNLIIGLALNLQFSALLERQAAEIATQFMRQNEGYLSLYLTELEQATATAVSNDEALALLRAPRHEGFYESLQAQRRLAESVDRSLYLRTDIMSFDVYAANGLSQVEGVPRYFAIEELDDEIWYARLSRADDRTVWAYEAATRSLVHARKIVDARTGDLLGYAAATIPTYRIESVLRRSRTEVHEYLALYDITTGRVAGPSDLPDELGSAMRDAYGQLVSTAERTRVVEIDDRLMVGTRVGDTSLQLVMFVETRSILRDAQRLRSFSIGVFLLVTVLMIAVWMQFSRRLTEPLSALAQTMNSFREGETMRVAPVQTNDEIGEVAKSYNAMLKRLNSLIREVYEEQLHRREAEWSALQAQINPHFLNNTLNSIASLSRARGVPEITQMVTSLAKLFRIVLTEQEKRIPLARELEYVRQYLRIQEVRYKERLRVEFAVDPNARQCLIPGFILQPLVENAIEHGIEPVESGGSILITARLAGDEACGEEGSVARRLLLEVRDDGAGMQPDRVGEVLRENRSRSGRIGLWNVLQRVRATEGDRSAVDIESRPGEGTAVQITIPVHQSEETHEVSRSRG
jgi:two-component system sensor histidine kinase YesM